MNTFINYKTLCLVILFLVFSVINNEAFADDELSTGPGLFSGKGGEFVLYNSGNEGKERKKVSTAPADTKVDEFSLYKEWRSAKEKQSPEYEEFKAWLEYKEYLRSQ